MNETIYDLIDAIKEDKRYLQFKEQSLKLLNQETKELLDNYQNLLQELDDLKKFEKYIDILCCSYCFRVNRWFLYNLCNIAAAFMMLFRADDGC